MADEKNGPDTATRAAISAVTTTERNANIESIHAAKDVATMITLIAAAVYLSTTGHGELAATALGGALSYAMPSARVAGRPVPPIAMGLILGWLVSISAS